VGAEIGEDHRGDAADGAVAEVDDTEAGAGAGHVEATVHVRRTLALLAIGFWPLALGLWPLAGPLKLGILRRRDEPHRPHPEATSPLAVNFGQWPRANGHQIRVDAEMRRHRLQRLSDEADVLVEVDAEVTGAVDEVFAVNSAGEGFVLHLLADRGGLDGGERF